MGFGDCTGALAQIFTIPVSVIATRQQVGSAKHTVRKVVVPVSDGITAVSGNGENQEDEGVVEKKGSTWISLSGTLEAKSFERKASLVSGLVSNLD